MNEQDCNDIEKQYYRLLQLEANEFDLILEI